MFEYFKATREFGTAAAVLTQYMTPETPREERRKILCSVINGLSGNTFNRDTIFKRIIQSNMIDMSIAISKGFENTDEQVKDVLSWLPRMDYHKGKLYKVIRDNRRKHGLKL